jgi:hypothetical protein
MPADPVHPDQLDGEQRFRADLVAYRDSLPIGELAELCAAPAGFTVADLAAKVQAMGGQTGHTIRQTAYDLRRLRGKNLLVKLRRSRRYQVPPTRRPHHRRPAGPPRPGHRSHHGRGPPPRLGRKPAHWTAIDRDYETLRIGMQTLLADFGIAARSAAA